MKRNYDDFATKNPTFKDRMNTFTSIISPDTKAVMLWAMQPGVAYDRVFLGRTVSEFSGTDFPVSSSGMWNYCQGHLYDSGMVYSPERRRYAKNDAGTDFGDALAAIFLTAMPRLSSRYRSAGKIFGTNHKRENSKSNRSYAVYLVVKALAQNPELRFNHSELVNTTGVDADPLSKTLLFLGDIGIINYISPTREKKGHRETGWSTYELNGTELLQADAAEIYGKITRTSPDFRLRTKLLTLLGYMSSHPDSVYSCETIKLSGIQKKEISYMLSLLEGASYLKPLRFRGRVRLSEAQTNQNTVLLWKELLEPAEAVALELDPYAHPAFRKAVDALEKDDERRRTLVRGALTTYNRERNQLGSDGAREVETALLAIPPGIEFKKSEIVQRVNDFLDRYVSRCTVDDHVRNLLKNGKFRHGKKHHFVRV